MDICCTEMGKRGATSGAEWRKEKGLGATSLGGVVNATILQALRDVTGQSRRRCQLAVPVCRKMSVCKPVCKPVCQVTVAVLEGVGTWNAGAGHLWRVGSARLQRQLPASQPACHRPSVLACLAKAKATRPKSEAFPDNQQSLSSHE